MLDIDLERRAEVAAQVNERAATDLLFAEMHKLAKGEDDGDHGDH